jgi:hypothetical protein
MNTNHLFITAILISLLYFLLKVIENKILSKDDLKLKIVFKDSLLVFLSVVIGLNLIEQIIPLIYEGSELVTNPPVFTDTPGF